MVWVDLILIFCQSPSVVIVGLSPLHGFRLLAATDFQPYKMCLHLTLGLPWFLLQLLGIQFVVQIVQQLSSIFKKWIKLQKQHQVLLWCHNDHWNLYFQVLAQWLYFSGLALWLPSTFCSLVFSGKEPAWAGIFTELPNVSVRVVVKCIVYLRHHHMFR